MKVYKNKYGHFDTDKNEYVITRIDTPRPWINVMSNGNWGLVLSQAGGGYSWMTHANLNRITRWNQDLVRDESGKHIYIFDDDKKIGGSITYQPSKLKPARFSCRHGIGYTIFNTRWNGLIVETTVFVHPTLSAEVWTVSVQNNRKSSANISLFYYLEWLLGRWHDSHREFHKTFFETTFNNNVIYAKKRLWEIPNAEGENWNRNWEGTAFLASNRNVDSFDTEKENFIGRYGNLIAPVGLNTPLKNEVGDGKDAIGLLKIKLSIPSGRRDYVRFFLGVGDDIKQVNSTIGSLKQDMHLQPEDISHLHLSPLKRWNVSTPDNSFDILNNVWLRHQAITGRIRARAAYYQSSGAYGYRDQLQDSQVFLQIEPSQTLMQIRLHSRHQYKDGTVHHWWHPITEEGAKTGISDDLLWLPYVISSYLKETDDFKSLRIEEPFLDAPKMPLYEHSIRAIDHVLLRMGKHGIPLIGDGDWNDGLNSVGDKEKGESFWVAMFLVGILKDFSYIARKEGDNNRSKKYSRDRKNLIKSLNKYGWDGAWYRRATTDTGRILGSSKEKEGRIFLNAETWALLNDIADDSKKGSVIRYMKKYLLREYGPLLLYPAYKTPDTEIGYLTRYAPGVRENGGLYTHAGTWAILSLAHIGNIDDAYSVFKSFNPILRGMNPDVYKVEPYVTPGNVDGPDSPNFGRGGWTWYTGSAAWLYRVCEQGILGVIPDFKGLHIRGTLPSTWDKAHLTRSFRGKIYNIHFKRQKNISIPRIYMEGNEISSNTIIYNGRNKSVDIDVLVPDNV